MAYEVDPFQKGSIGHSTLAEVETRYFEQLGLKRGDQRHIVASASQVRLVHESVPLAVEDFSHYGFCVTSPQLYGRRSVFNVRIETSNPLVDKAIAANLMRKITVEVRWSRGTAGRFVHGLRIVGASTAQRDFLYRLLRDHLSTEGRDNPTDPTAESSLVA